nr:reverse transcriptase domain-containing protein [Tanacetum cinerariifolium]
MLTAIVGRRWVFEHGLCLAIIKCDGSIELRQVFIDVVSTGIAKGMSEGLKHKVEHGKAKVDLVAIEVYDPEADTTLHALKDLKYSLVDQLEKLKDAPIDVIMSSLYFKSDSGEDALQWIRELRPSSSKLKILMYPEVRNPKDPWSFKEDILLEDAIAANISHAKKKKKCRVSNGLVERANRSLGEGIKARLVKGNKNWIEELPYVFWAHRTMIKSSHSDTLFSLTYGTEAVIPAEIRIPTYRTTVVDAVHNNEELRLNLDLLEEWRECVAIRKAKEKLQMTKYYNTRVRGITFRPGGIVYHSNKPSHAMDGGKLGLK